LIELWGCRAATIDDVYCEDCTNFLCNPQDNRTFNRLLGLTIETRGPYTMPIKVCYDGVEYRFSVRFQKYGADVVLILSDFKR